MRVALLVVALAFGACVIDSPKPAAARFQVEWTFEGGGDCETLGVEIVQVNLLPDEQSDAAPAMLTDQFLCTDLIGVTHAVEAQVPYSVQLVAYDADDNELGRSEARTESAPGSGQTAELEPFVIDTSGG
jgi:hypothetical protein